MKLLLFAIIASCSFFVTSCNKKLEGSSMVETKVTYSHPDSISGGNEITRQQEAGTIGEKVPSTGQIISLPDSRQVSFSQSTDASDPENIRVILQSEGDGLPVETQILNFNSNVANPPSAVFKNGLRAAVKVKTYTR